MKKKIMRLPVTLKHYVFVVFMMLLFSYTSSVAQTEEKISTQSTYVELGGNGLIVSFNYDTRFSRTKPGGLGAKAGFGGLAIGDFKIFTVPLNLNYLLGKNGKYFEVGLGTVYTTAGFFQDEDSNVAQFLGTMIFGYRSQPVDGGFTFRAGLTPVFGNLKVEGEPDTFIFIPYFGGISFGYAF
ncbi:MAG: hypothetical protein ACKVPJ_08665 [Chitinophagales bacterium]